MYIVWIAVIASITGLIGAIIQYLEKEKSDIESDKLKEDLALANKQLMNLNGGDSYCFIVMSNLIEGEFSVLELSLATRGEFNMYDISVSFIDYTPEGSNFEEYMRSFKVPKTINMMRPQQLSEFLMAYQTGGRRLYIIAYMNARNYSFMQYLSIFYKDNRWITATQLLRQKPNSIEFDEIFTTASDDFPRKEGKIDWNFNLEQISNNEI